MPGASASPTLDRLFAYGTLMAGYSRRPLLGDALLEGEARIRGSVYDFGDYPGVVLDDRGWVVGELYRVPGLGARLSVIDRAEWCDPAAEATSLYLRRPVPVIQDGAAPRDAWVYVYNQTVGGPPQGRARIESGDWRAHLAARAAIAR